LRAEGEHSKGQTMSSKNLPYFKFMVSDWMSGTIFSHDMETQGVFINLCARMWKNGGTITGDIDRLSRLLGRVDKQMLSKCLDLLEQDELVCLDKDGNLYVKFICAQLEDRAALHVKRSDAGRKGGKANAKQMLSKCLHKESESETESEHKTEETRKRVVFVKPSVEEIKEYCKSRDNTIDAEYFFNSYESKGWMIGNTKMKNWKSTICTWECRDKDRKAQQHSQPSLPTQTLEQRYTPTTSTGNE